MRGCCIDNNCARSTHDYRIDRNKSGESTSSSFVSYAQLYPDKSTNPFDECSKMNFRIYKNMYL